MTNDGDTISANDPDQRIIILKQPVGVVAAITPLPFSATCAVVGAVGFDRKRYLIYSLARFIRYAIYGFFIWLAHPF